MRLFSLLPATVLIALVSAATMTPASAQTQVYFNNFDGTQTFGAGAAGALTGFTTTENVQGFAGLGPAGNQFSGNFLHNDSAGNPATLTTLTLTNLPAHSSVNVNFLLAVIDSWDGQQAPDIFNVRVAGVTVFSPSFAIASGTTNYAPPAGVDIGGGIVARGFNGSWGDEAFNMYLEPSLNNIAHTGSSLTVDIFASGSGWQGTTDESWGIDNLQVSLNGVTTSAPEPGSFALLGLGLIGMAGTAVRKRRNYSKA